MNGFFRTKLASGCLLAALFAPIHAFGTPVSFASLPESPARWRPTFKSAPKAISARERVPGFVVDRNQPGALVVAPAKSKSKASAPEEPPLGPSDWCFGVNTPISDEQTKRGMRSGWDRYASEAGYLYRGGIGSPVAALRAERWVDGAERSRVEVVEFWIDQRTGGARLVRSATFEVARVATPNPGFEVYATRTGPDSVDFFLKSVPSPAVEAFAATLVRAPLGSSEARALGFLKSVFGGFSPMTLLSKTEDRTVSVSSCRHLHVELDTAYGQSELVGVVTQLVVGAPEVIERPDAPAPDPQGPPSSASIEMRTIGLSLGLSRLASDKAPMPSLSYRWEDRGKELEL